MKILVIACLAIVASAFAEQNHISLQKFSGNGRITNGHDAAPGQFPWQISLQWGWPPFQALSHVCGGALISNEWVITAGHCFTELPSYGSFGVKAGKHVINKDEPTQQYSDISFRLVHPDYEGGVNPNDIALIKLSTPFTLNERVAPVNLPPANVDHTGNVVASGWGSTSLTSSSVMPSILQTITVPVISNSECLAILASHVSGDLPLRPTNICTGDIGDSRISMCSGDSGGPLVQENGGVWEHVGIVSWGLHPCGSPGTPSVFTRTASFVDWINQSIADNS